MEDLFEYTTAEDNELEIKDVQEIISDYQILSKTRIGNKTWEETFKSMHQICNGTFFGSHNFDQNWLNRLVDKYDIFALKFTWPELVMRTRQILDYITERKPLGFWYPKAPRISLNEFFCSQMKSGKCWSPFIDLNYNDCVTPQMWRKLFGPKLCEILDNILEDSWFDKSYETRCKFYKGVDKLHEWYLQLPDSFTRKCDSNMLVFGKFSLLLEAIRQCNKETGCVYPGFINESQPKWSVLIDWLKKKKHVELD